MPPSCGQPWKPWRGLEKVFLRAEARAVLDGPAAESSTDQREALMLLYMERLSVAEIAVVMGRSPGADQPAEPGAGLVVPARTGVFPG